MKTIALGELFTSDQLAEIADIMNTSEDDLEATKRLRLMFKRIGPQLEKHGLLPDYAAYAVPFWIRQSYHQQDN